MDKRKAWKIIVKAAMDAGLTRKDKRELYEDVYTAHSDAMLDILAVFVNEYGLHEFGAFRNAGDWCDAVQNAYLCHYSVDPSGALMEAVEDIASDEGLPHEFFEYMDWPAYMQDQCYHGPLWVAGRYVYDVRVIENY